MEKSSSDENDSVPAILENRSDVDGVGFGFGTTVCGAVARPQLGATPLAWLCDV